MRRLIVSEFMTLDGVMEAPGFEEHRTGRNAWALRMQNEETERFKEEELYAAGAILLGRTTYQIWAAFWPTALKRQVTVGVGETKDEAFARRVNEIPKYVVSNTLNDPGWNNVTVLRGDIGPQVAQLKDQPGREIIVY